jgi:hypothetical protein
MPPVFLYKYGLPLLVLHALCGLALCGASVHQAVIAVAALAGRLRPRLARIYGLTGLCLYAATLLFGALLYPRYRYFVRALYLDRHAPWAANLFDFKENLATLGLPLCAAAFVLSRDLDALRGEREVRALYAFFSLGQAAIVLFNAVAGLLVTGVRGA